MRKPRDFDAELKALNDKAKRLKDRKLMQLGELVIATGADALPMEVLTGALLAAGTAGAEMQEGWREAAAPFFRRSSRSARQNSHDRAATARSDSRTTPPDAPANQA